MKEKLVTWVTMTKIMMRRRKEEEEEE